jgi:hypothetical protein
MTPIDDAHRGAARGGGTFRLPGRFGRLDASDDDAGRAAARGEVGRLDASDDNAGRAAARGEVGRLDVRGRRR